MYSTIRHEIKNDIFINMTIRLDMKCPKCLYKLGEDQESEKGERYGERERRF